MAIVTTDNKHYTNIAVKIREKTNETEFIFPNEMADKVEEVYQKGVSDGVKSEYDRFWDKFQNYGKRVAYQYAFGGQGWTKETFKPKYDIKPTSMKGFFSYGGLMNCDLAEIIETLGITFDTSGVTAIDGFEGFCEYAGPKRLPIIDTSNCARINEFVLHASILETVDKLILKNDGSQTYTNAFRGCSKLTNIVIEGTIGSEFSTKDSPLLSKASITSIVNALSSTTTGLTVTLSLIAVNNAFETSIGLADGSTSQEWLDLVATKPNWTISLA